MEIKPKFDIGDYVRIVSKKTTFKGKVACPLCGGKHKIPNTTKCFGWEEDFMECPYCEDDGMVSTDPLIEKSVNKSVYKIDRIFVTIDKDECSYSYRHEDEHSSSITVEELLVGCNKNGELLEEFKNFEGVVE